MSGEAGKSTGEGYRPTMESMLMGGVIDATVAEVAVVDEAVWEREVDEPDECME